MAGALHHKAFMPASLNCRSSATRDKVLTAEGGQDHNGAGAARIATLAGSETCSPLVAGGKQELYMSLHQHSCCWLKQGSQYGLQGV